MPTPIARLSDIGTARMIASRRPTRTSSRTIRPSRTMTPIAPAGVSPFVRTSPNATSPLMPRPAASAIGTFATTPMRIVMSPATSAVPAARAGTDATAASDPGPNMFERMLGFTSRM